MHVRERFNWAACKIQATWRMYKTNKHFKKNQEGFVQGKDQVQFADLKIVAVVVVGGRSHGTVSFEHPTKQTRMSTP